MSRIADQYVENISTDEILSQFNDYQRKGWRDIWWSSMREGDWLHITWYGTRPRCTCELYGECARCEPQRQAHQPTEGVST